MAHRRRSRAKWRHEPMPATRAPMQGSEECALAAPVTPLRRTPQCHCQCHTVSSLAGLPLCFASQQPRATRHGGDSTKTPLLLSRPAPLTPSSRLPASAVRTVAPSRRAPAHARATALSIVACPRAPLPSRLPSVVCSQHHLGTAFTYIPHPQRLPAAATPRRRVLSTALTGPSLSTSPRPATMPTPAHACPRPAALPLARRRMHRFSQCSSSLPPPMPFRPLLLVLLQSPRRPGHREVSSKCKRLMLHPAAFVSPSHCHVI